MGVFWWVLVWWAGCDGVVLWCLCRWFLGIGLVTRRLAGFDFSWMVMGLVFWWFVALFLVYFDFVRVGLYGW